MNGDVRVGAGEAWPTLISYDSDHLDRISLPLGGIGTGTIGLGGRGDLRDFELGNRPGKGFRPGIAFLAVRVQRDGARPLARVLEGPLSEGDFQGMSGSPAPNHGLPRFPRARFDAAYPLGQVHLEDPALPPVTVAGFNPLVPGDVDASSWPIVELQVVITNTFDSPIVASVAGVMQNFIGANGTDDVLGANQNEVKSSDELVGVLMSAPELDPKAEAQGEFFMGMVRTAGETVSTRTGWAEESWAWGDALLDFWDDFLHDGELDERTTTSPRPTASVATSMSIDPGQEGVFRLLLTWSFPNRRAWKDDEGFHDARAYGDEVVRNYYSIVHPDPWRTALDALDALPSLEKSTVAAITAIVDSTAPRSIREAALFNISTLRSPTVFRTDDGRFYGWEGVMDRSGVCFGTCNHVWGYEFATSYWFSDLAWSFRNTQYTLATHDNGLMSFRVGMPTSRSKEFSLAAADGQMATLVHLFHDWKLSGDLERLRELWPAARRSLEFAWISGGWDADHDGVMEGCQHNTMDVEYYGPNPQMGGWYLAALRACAEMARALGELEFAATCEGLFVAGSRWIDENLFTGTHYSQEIRPVGTDGLIADGLRHPTMGSSSLDDPDLQLGNGVLVDQLVGQYASKIAGLGEILDPTNVRTTLQTIFDRNFKRDFHDHFNRMRSFVLADETGLLMCTYEEGQRPQRPFPYYTEVMTGFEYTAAVGMIQEGHRENAVSVIDAIRSRFNGRRRNPFDEIECGHHYARAMTSWSAFVAWNRFDYDGRTATFSLGLDEPTGQTFWSTGSAWGNWSQVVEGDSVNATLTVLGGDIAIREVVVGETRFPVTGEPKRPVGSVIQVEGDVTRG